MTKTSATTASTSRIRTSWRSRGSSRLSSIDDPSSGPAGAGVPAVGFMVVRPMRVLPKAHPLADLGHRRLGHRAEAIGAHLEDAFDLGRVGQQLEVALASGCVVADDPLREQLLRVDAAGPGGALPVLDLFPVLAEEAVQLAH